MIAVISDVHGILPALTAVFDDIARHDIADVWRLGDTVGYGRCSIMLAGNRDYGAGGT
jgi:predicted phosphodiesterase